MPAEHFWALYFVPLYSCLEFICLESVNNMDQMGSLFCFCFYILKEIVKDDSNEDYAAETICDPPSYLLTGSL